MISRQRVEEIAAGWARRESTRRGYDCTPMLDEFDLGYVVWSPVPPQVVPMPGDGSVTVIDKATGEITSFPGLPRDLIAERYREHLAQRQPRVTLPDPGADSVPATAARLVTGQGQLVANGVKGDAEPVHHPLVRAYLDRLAPGHLTRGGDRHAELVVLSAALHRHDGQLGDAVLEVFRVRESGDPLGGPAGLPCESCVHALVHFGTLAPSYLMFVEESARPAGADPVRGALVDGGWQPDRDDPAAAAMVERVAAEHGHEPFPAAQDALARYLGVATSVRGPGVQVFVRRFSVDPLAVAHTARTLTDVAAVVDARLFPIGTESGDSILAVDERGRVFALDQAGGWFLGPDVDTALAGLVTGRAVPRVRDDGTW